MDHKVFHEATFPFNTSTFFDYILKNSKQASIFIINEQGKIETCSLGVLLAFGYLPEDLAGKDFSILFTEEDKKIKKPETEIATAYQKGSATDYNYIVHKDGSHIWVYGESVFVKDADGNIFYVKTLYDLNQQKLLEGILAESVELAGDIFDLIREPAVILDTNLRIIKANILFINIFYTDVKDSKSSSLTKIAKGFFNKLNFTDKLKEIIEQDIINTDFDTEFESPTLGKKHLSIHVKKIGYGTQKENKILLSITDITTYKEETNKLYSEKQALEKINRDLDTFVYTASHDLKAPINNISALLDIIKESTADREDCQLVISLAQESIIKFQGILEDLAEIGKDNAHSGVNSIQFKDIVEEVKILLKEEILQSKAEIHEEYPTISSVNYPRRIVRTILQNLISNAIKFCPAERNPIIKISTLEKSSEVVLLVADNGIGIKKEDQYKVFTMYKRIHSHIEGTGVGLAMIKRIIENDGGKIEFETVLNEGTIFKVYFKKR